MKRILAIGGGGFLMEDNPSPIDRFIVQLTGKPKPRICYIGTASGDMPDGIEKFYAAFPPDRCEPSHLAFFRKPSPGSLPLAAYEPQLAAQDAIFVGGGNTKSALGVWREWGLDQAFARAYASGRPAERHERRRDVLVRSGPDGFVLGCGLPAAALSRAAAGRLRCALQR